jgi:hypothetical protein
MAEHVNYNAVGKEEKPVDPIDPIAPIDPVDPVDDKPKDEEPKDEEPKDEEPADEDPLEEAVEAAVEAAEAAAEAYAEAVDEGRVVSVGAKDDKFVRPNVDDIGKLRVRETPEGTVADHVTNKERLLVIDETDPNWSLVEYTNNFGTTVRGYVKKSLVVEA